MGRIKTQLKSPLNGHAPQFLSRTGVLGWNLKLMLATNLIYVNNQMKLNQMF
jgi:hypothetical protein